MLTGLIISNSPLNLTDKTSITGFEISGAQPDGTDRRLAFKVDGLAMRGSRTYPITTNAAASDTVTICGVAFTAIASGATGNQFNIGGTIAITASNLATTLNANATVSALYTATVDSNGIITLTEKFAGGNTPAVATKAGTIVIGTGTAVTSVATWYKLTVTGGIATLTALPTQKITAASVIAEGNSVSELMTATSVPPFAGKLIYPAIALSAAAYITAMPTLQLTKINGLSNQDQYTKVEYSQEYDLSECVVYNTNLSASSSNGGSVIVEASVYSSGTWSDYMTLSALKEKTGDKVKFRFTYTATIIGVSAAQVNYLYVYIRTNSSVTLGTNADLITKTQDFGTGMMYARLLIKHERFKDAGGKAYINFTDIPLCRENYQIGTGTGEPQTITLTDPGIDFTSLKLYANITYITDFDFNTTLNTITFTSAAGATIFVNYEYGFGKEIWQAMQKGTTQPYQGKGYDSTDFTYSITGVEKGVSTIRMVMEKPDGSSTDEYLGVGTGRSQLFFLAHYAKEETITLKQGTQPIDNKNWSYDPINKIVTAIALKDTTVSATYQWTAETPKILGYVAAWNQ